jgi:hypothetical protein
VILATLSIGIRQKVVAGAIFADMAIHDCSSFLAGDDRIDILAVGACHIAKSHG